MSRRALLLVFVLISIVLATGPSTAAQNSLTDMQADQEIRKLNAAEVDAFLKNDPLAMEHLWSDDFVVTNPLNKFATKQQVLGMMRSGFLILTAYRREIEYLRLYGDTAIVAGNETVTWGGQMPNAGKAENLRFTAIWMKQGGRWQEVARHANVIPESN